MFIWGSWRLPLSRVGWYTQSFSCPSKLLCWGCHWVVTTYIKFHCRVYTVIGSKGLLLSLTLLILIPWNLSAPHHHSVTHYFRYVITITTHHEHGALCTVLFKSSHRYKHTTMPHRRLYELSLGNVCWLLREGLKKNPDYFMTLIKFPWTPTHHPQRMTYERMTRCWKVYHPPTVEK